MKKLISVFLSVLLVISMATAVSAADKNNNGKGNGKKNGQAVESAQTTETTPALVPAVALEGLLKQLKENHRDKAIRKLLHNRIKEIRKQNGDHTIPVIVNGELIQFDVPPVIKQNRTLIPVRAVANALGASVEWDRETNDVTVTKAVYSNVEMNIETIIKVVIDLDTGKFYKDGVEVDFDVPAQVINNRTVVPIRFLAEIFGMKVDWDKDLDGVVVDEAEKVTYPTPTATPTPAPDPSPTPTP